MKLKGQHIGRIFTFLAGLIILVHGVVSHHHHFELKHSSELESICESSAQDKNTEPPDFHCQAFNILASGKTTISSFNNSLSDFFSFYLAGIIVNIEIPPVKIVTTTIFGYQAVFLKQFFFTTRSLRGPPANA
ncbi:MAG TPA: hypothetical protein DHV48_02220 [Prolixibacteraceae bacterium]|nr:hypothetical protein [Prolixibacteraceae bacterium]